jgi:hypothetical protein
MQNVSIRVIIENNGEYEFGGTNGQRDLLVPAFTVGLIVVVTV